MISDLKDKLERFSVIQPQKKSKQKFDISEALGGEVYLTEKGGFIIRQADYPFGTPYGDYIIEKAQSSEFSDDRFLFVDTETTGLGAGACAFLIGIAYFTEEGLSLEQIFLRDLDDEEAALDYLISNYSDMTAVSYNGKSFDIPLLRGRCVINGIRSAGFAEKHIDLLHLSRRIWKKRLESCRLGSIEEEILKFTREDDVPGSMVPELYKEYLKTGKPDNIVSILEHNENDVVSMSVLLAKIFRIEKDPLGELNNIIDVFHLGEAEFNRNQYDKAKECLESVIHTRTDTVTLYTSMKYLSLIHKQRCEWDKALYYWDRMDKVGLQAVFPLIELAKYYEHKEKDIGKALGFAEKARLNASKLYSKDKMSELDARIKRLKSKITEENK